MGRYYEGDIDGKFWFAIQSSDDGEHFGAEPQESNYIDYWLPRDVWEDEGLKMIKKCEKALDFKYRNKKYNYEILHNEWDKYASSWYEKHKENVANRHFYLGFQEWLKEEKKIGKGLPSNEKNKKLRQKLEVEFHPIWVWLARLDLGRKMEKFFNDNPEVDDLYYNAEC